MAVPEVERPAYGVHTGRPVRYLPDAKAEHRHLIPVREDAGAPVCGCCTDRHGGGSLAASRSKRSRTAIEPSPIAVAARLTGPLDRPAADIADGEDSGPAGFQEQGRPVLVL